MRLIPLKHGGFAMVDDEDFERLSKYSWRLSRWGYVVRTSTKDKKKVMFMMEWEVKGRKPGFLIDHKDLNPLNNQKGNLRYATKSTNGANAKLSKRNKTGFKGVTLYKATGKYRATIVQDRQQHHLGFFLTKEEARDAYQKAALNLYGEFARF